MLSASVIVKTDGSFAALMETDNNSRRSGWVTSHTLRCSQELCSCLLRPNTLSEDKCCRWDQETQNAENVIGLFWSLEFHWYFWYFGYTIKTKESILVNEKCIYECWIYQSCWKIGFVMWVYICLRSRPVDPDVVCSSLATLKTEWPSDQVT